MFAILLLRFLLTPFIALLGYSILANTALVPWIPGGYWFCDLWKVLCCRAGSDWPSFAFINYGWYMLDFSVADSIVTILFVFEADGDANLLRAATFAIA